MSIKILNIDIETAPNKVYAWGLFNQDISINQIEEPGYTMCFAAKWRGEDEVMFYSMYEYDYFDMIKAAHTLLDEADVVVHYNGTKFDMPTLNREMLLEGMSPPSPYHQVDLLKVVKKCFRFPSNKLDYISRALGLSGKVSHKGMELWKECMEGDELAWGKMEEYNKQDVLLLDSLYDILLPWVSMPTNVGLYEDTDRPLCPSCGSTKLTKQGTRKTKTQEYQQYRCKDCGSWHRGRTTLLTAEKRKHILC